jgi:hypothetical protein
MLYPVLVKEIKASKKTLRITGASNVQEFNKIKDSVFAGKKDKEIMDIIDDVYNYKLAHSLRTEILNMSLEDKIQHLIGNLTFQAQFRQETPRQKNEGVNAVGFFLRNRLNVSNSVGSKVFYQTMTYDVVTEEGFDRIEDLSATLAEQGKFIYLFRQNSFNPEVNSEGQIVSAPKRKGAGGNILCKTDPETGKPRIIFQHTILLMDKVESKEELEAMLNKAQEAEKANSEEFKSDCEIDVVENEIPAEVRGENGAFALDFQQWLHEQVYEGLSMQTKIVAQAVAA